MNTTITCPHCKKPFEISEAIEHQIQDELLKAKTEQAETMRKEYEAESERRVQQALQSAQAQAQLKAESLIAKERQDAALRLAKETQDAELRHGKELQNAQLELEKARLSIQQEVEKAKQTTELEATRLRHEITAAKESEKQLREQSAQLLEEISKANKAREDAEFAARKKMLDQEKIIREEAIIRASEDYNTKIREQEETINRLREQLTTAKQVAEQGSQQLQGEILELDIEQNLRSTFPLDTIEEVKKGERGSDIRQTVNDRLYQNCGLILWECKNAKTYQASWLGKLKDELAVEKAQIGIIVFNPTDGNGDDYIRLEENIWLVKPRYAIIFATLLRQGLVNVFTANRNAEGKDVKIEMLYNYMAGGEFSNRMRYISEGYDEMLKQLDTEKKQAYKRWATQEKTIQKIQTSIYGASGDLHGITGMELIALPALDNDEDESKIEDLLTQS